MLLVVIEQWFDSQSFSKKEYSKIKSIKIKANINQQIEITGIRPGQLMIWNTSFELGKGEEFHINQNRVCGANLRGKNTNDSDGGEGKLVAR